MIQRIKHIELLLSMDLPADKYLITGSSWLAILGLRENKDIDIIVGDDIRSRWDYYLARCNSLVIPKIRESVNISKKHARAHVELSGEKTVEDLIQNRYRIIDGLRFVEFDIFRRYKKRRKRDRDKADNDSIKTFFAKGLHKSPEFAAFL